MQFVTLRRNGRSEPGVIIGDDILGLAGAAEMILAARGLPHNLRGIIKGGETLIDSVRRIVDLARKDSVAQNLRETGALTPRKSARLGAPIPDVSFILSCGMNSREHVKEMNSPPPERPYGFSKSPGAVIGSGDSIVLPKSNPNMVDWEGEFSVVIGKPCHNVKAVDAMDYVMGYTLINDVSARDWSAGVRTQTGIMGPILAWDRNLLGKQFPTFCPMGPTVVTKDAIPDVKSVHLTTSLNGQVMQSATMEDLIFDVGQLIEYYSQFYLFQPGDILTTGSPSGVGHGRKPPLYMKPGDIMDVYVDAIGTLSNPVVMGQ